MQKRKPARLQQARNGIWFIRDNIEGRRIKRSTGARCRSTAEKVLSRYIAERDNAVVVSSSPDQLTVATVLHQYADQKETGVKDPRRIGYAISALVPLIGKLPVAQVNGAVCRRYLRLRERAPATVRRELGVLQAAINFAVQEGLLTTGRKVWLPPKPAPRDRWLTREEADQFIRAAQADPHTQHVARFALIGLYTGTRTAAILRLQYIPNTEGGWVDLERGILHRRGVGMVDSKKRQPPIPIPEPLLVRLHEWQKDGNRFLIHYRGQRVGNIKRSWKAVLAASGIEHCTRHDLRRTAITWAMQAGAPIWQVAGFFGVSTSVLEKVYAVHHPDHMKDAVQAMAGWQSRA